LNADDSPRELRYVAYVSYNHADRPIAKWLHRGIETYRLPANVRAELSKLGSQRERLKPVFMDREELSSSADLAESVRSALQQSAFLIVICSPNAARSRWVNEEIRSFKALGRSNKILCLIVAGETNAADKGRSADLECFPPALRFEVEDGRVTGRRAAEPLAADTRAGADAKRDAKLKIIAGLLGINLDDLRQRDQARRQRRLALISVAATVGCIVLAGLTIAAWIARNEAEQQRRLAVEKSLTAERTADFVISLFRVSDPSEARGNSITAREILDRGARQIDSSLRNEPQVRADLSTTLGEVYTGLGLYGAAFDLLSKARAVAGQNAVASMRETIALAELETHRDNYAQADELLTRADALVRQTAMHDPQIRARILLARGEVAAFQERTANAKALFDEALTLAAQNQLAEVNARALEGLGMAAAWGGELASAQQWYTQALAARIALSGETHPRVSDLLNNIASVAYLSGDSQRAEAIYLRLLDVDRRVLGPNHPELAVTMANIGRLRLEQRQFSQAIGILEQGIPLMLAQRDETRDEFAFVFSNLALAYMGLSDYAKAEPLFQKGLHAAILNKHRLHAPILTDLADLECRTKRYEAGLARLDEARPIMAARYPDDPWRVALVDSVKGGCLLGLNRRKEAESLLLQSAPVIQKKWKSDTLYGYDVTQRSTRLRNLAAKE